MTKNTFKTWFLKGVKIRMDNESCNFYEAWRWAISRHVFELDAYILKNEESK